MFSPPLFLIIYVQYEIITDTVTTMIRKSAKLFGNHHDFLRDALLCRFKKTKQFWEILIKSKIKIE